jgi:hypothetical protein
LEPHERSLQYVNALSLVIISLTSNTAVWTEISPVKLLSSIANSPGISMTLSDSGWLSCSYAASRTLLWLPMERHGKTFASHGRRVVVGANSGAVTVLELPTEPARYEMPVPQRRMTPKEFRNSLAVYTCFTPTALLGGLSSLYRAPNTSMIQLHASQRYAIVTTSD